MRGRYGHLRPAPRARARLMPTLEAIDMRKRRPAARPTGSRRGWRWRSAKTIARGEQALLFLNRRGYAPLTLCRTCGHRFRCEQLRRVARRASLSPRADVPSLRPYRASPERVPRMRREDSLAACGPGVERLAEEAATLFPDARILVLSSDFPGGAERLRRELEEIAKGDLRHRHRHATRRQGPQFSPSHACRRRSTRILGLAAAIRARPSAPFSCSIR